MPATPVTPAAPSPSSPAATSDADAGPDDPKEADRMAILRALEQGELDVPTAMDRLAALDGDAAGQSDAGPGQEPDPSHG